MKLTLKDRKEVARLFKKAVEDQVVATKSRYEVANRLEYLLDSDWMSPAGGYKIVEIIDGQTDKFLHNEHRRRPEKMDWLDCVEMLFC